MNSKLMVCAVIGAVAMTGCASTTPAAIEQTNARNIDYARIEAVERNARYLGVQVIWLNRPVLR